MQKESNEILVDSYRAGIIDKIAKDNTTIFTNFDDFVNEAIGTYIVFWTDPAQAQGLFENLLPHMKSEQLEYMKEMMDENEYEGGNFEVNFNEPNREDIHVIKPARQKGSVTIFPSFVWHRVLPITKGTRYAIVGWIHGNHFK